MKKFTVQQQYRLLEDGKKGCANCGKIRTIDRFQKQKTKLGYRGSCKYCRHINDRKKDARGFLGEDEFWHRHDTSKRRIVDKKNKVRDVARDRIRYIKNTYKVDFKIAADLYKKSTEKVCEICKKTSKENGKALAIDHCHTTGKIRGILCQKCNLGIGFLKDNIQFMKKAIKYLKGGH